MDSISGLKFGKKHTLYPDKLPKTKTCDPTAILNESFGEGGLHRVEGCGSLPPITLFRANHPDGSFTVYTDSLDHAHNPEIIDRFDEQWVTGNALAVGGYTGLTSPPKAHEAARNDKEKLAAIQKFYVRDENPENGKYNKHGDVFVVNPNSGASQRYDIKGNPVE